MRQFPKVPPIRRFDLFASYKNVPLRQKRSVRAHLPLRSLKNNKHRPDGLVKAYVHTILNHQTTHAVHLHNSPMEEILSEIS